MALLHSRDDVEVSEEARRHWVSATARGSAGAHEDNIDDLPELQGLAVVPVGAKPHRTVPRTEQRTRLIRVPHDNALFREGLYLGKQSECSQDIVGCNTIEYMFNVAGSSKLVPVAHKTQLKGT